MRRRGPAGTHREAALPVRGLLISGVSLGGVSLGDSPADVEATWGTDYAVCTTCGQPGAADGVEGVHRLHALSARNGSTVTSIYTQAEIVYGFALTAPGRSVCL